MVFFSFLFVQLEIAKISRLSGSLLFFYRNRGEEKAYIFRVESFPNMEVEQRLRGRIVRRPKEQVWMLKTDSVLNIINIYINKAQTNSKKWIQGVSKCQIWLPKKMMPNIRERGFLIIPRHARRG